MNISEHGEGEGLMFHSVHFWVSNTVTSSSYFITRWGFVPVAHKGLFNGSVESSVVLKLNDIYVVVTGDVRPEESEYTRFVSKHSDAIRDVMFAVDDCSVYDSKDSEVVVATDEFGSVRFRVIKTFGDVQHTLVENVDYAGPFLPGYVRYDHEDPIVTLLPPTGLTMLDHFVGNLEMLTTEPTADWYRNVFNFNDIYYGETSTGLTGLKTIVVGNENVRITLLEPLPTKKIGQNQEFLMYNNGPGVQHIAFQTDDIISSVRNLKKRGVIFQTVPDVYHDILSEKLAKANFTINESFEDLRAEGILLDFDENGYLLQIFAKLVQDRPTLFFELIQRSNHEGFGEGNIKVLFSIVEAEQKQRGNF